MWPRQTLTAPAEIAISRSLELSTRVAGRPSHDARGDHFDARVRIYSPIVNFTVPLVQVSHSGPPLGDTTIWIGAAVLSGMLGNLAYDIFRGGMSRVIAKLQHRGKKR